MTIPTAVAGAITIVFLVALGIFIYPLLLKRRAGFVILAAVTVALAMHWFDLDRFYAEVRRVLKPNGIIAVWGYGFTEITSEVDAVL